MCRELKVSLKFLVLLLTQFSSTYNSHGKLILDGSAYYKDSLLILTNTTKHSYGQAFSDIFLDLRNHSFNFNTFFAIVPEHKQQGSHGMAFVLSPTRGLPGASSDQYLGLFNETNNGKKSNHIIAIELDIHEDKEFGDIDDNHVGININGLKSVESFPAGYFDNKDGKFNKLSLISGEVMRLSVGYSHPHKQLNVSLSPANMSVPPRKPLLSYNQDLSPYLLEKMYFGFTASTGSVGALHYMLSGFYDGEAEFSSSEAIAVPVLPPYPKKSYKKITTILVVCLTLAMIAALFASWMGSVFYIRHKKVKEVLEEWEIQYGPHRFAYKDLYNATKGFKEKQLLGKGGFGQVYRGTLPGSNTEIAAKRTSHDSRQGMNEFLAEISTIGRLRHPNLVRLLGYCKHIENLYLVYDFMPNGSLDKYLNRSNINDDQEQLTWEQRFKIIKDIASALLHLHQEWVQVIIHRDIKPANVLIDHEMNARLGDFGLAKLYDQGFDPLTSRVAGTLGYIAPDFLRTGRATTSSDVYAFGLVMLEVVCGRKLIERSVAENEEVLVDWIIELWENGKIFYACEESIRQEQNRGKIELVLKLGMLCSHHAELIRPNMSAIMQILSGDSQLPDSLLDVIRAEGLRGMPETPMEVLLGLDRTSFGTMTLTNSSVSHEL